MDATTAIYVANEARKLGLKISIAQLQGSLSNAAAVSQALSSTAQDANRALQGKQAELAALESGAGPGVTDDFGYKADILAAFLLAAQSAGLITGADLIANLQALAAGTYTPPAPPAPEPTTADPVPTT